MGAGPQRHGQLAGISADVVRLFSTRRAEIEAAMAARGGDLGPRRAGRHLGDPASQGPGRGRSSPAGWMDGQGPLAGFDPTSLTRLLRRRQPEPVTVDQQQEVERHVTSPAGLTERASTFDRLAVLRAWCHQLPAGAPVTTIEDLADRFLTTHDAIVALTDSASAVIRGGDGRILSTVSTGGRCRPPELLTLEARLLATVTARADEGCGVVNDEDLAASFRSHPTLSKEQARVVVEVCGSGKGVDVVTAPAGAGKTFTLDGAREAWNDMATGSSERRWPPGPPPNSKPPPGFPRPRSTPC